MEISISIHLAREQSFQVDRFLNSIFLRKSNKTSPTVYQLNLVATSGAQKVMANFWYPQEQYIVDRFIAMQNPFREWKKKRIPASEHTDAWRRYIGFNYTAMQRQTNLKIAAKTKHGCSIKSKVSEALSQLVGRKKQLHECKTIVKDKHQLPSQGCTDECMHTDG